MEHKLAKDRSHGQSQNEPNSLFFVITPVIFVEGFNFPLFVQMGGGNLFWQCNFYINM